MSTILNNTVKTEIQISAILDAYAYLDNQETRLSGNKLSDILNEDNFDPEDEYYQIIKKALTTMPELGDYVLISQSSQDQGDYDGVYVETTGAISSKYLYAVTFQAPDGTVYVAYRGTGDGKWVDNGQAMYKEASDMQLAAGAYFDHVVESQGLTADDRIIVTGHSKGGNSAQYAALGSKNALLVDNCYSFDGQGFSDLALKKFQDTLGSNYIGQIDKMYSINGENDYVHDLGNVIIPEERTYFVDNTESV